MKGLSPRVRGNPERDVSACPALGLSPRVRGNQSRTSSLTSQEGGLSPRVRGNPYSIAFLSPGDWVYPRVCGGTTHDTVVAPSHPAGLSPRVRGNLILSDHQHNWFRSIPACAGEPIPVLHSVQVVAVYPRVCGGTPSSFTV